MIPWSEFGCGGWYERLNLKRIPPSLPCGGDDPEHIGTSIVRSRSFTVSWHAAWAEQIEACERMWSAESATAGQ